MQILFPMIILLGSSLLPGMARIRSNKSEERFELACISMQQKENNRYATIPKSEIFGWFVERSNQEERKSTLTSGVVNPERTALSTMLTYVHLMEIYLGVQQKSTYSGECFSVLFLCIFAHKSLSYVTSPSPLFRNRRTHPSVHRHLDAVHCVVNRNLLASKIEAESLQFRCTSTQGPRWEEL